MQKIIVFDDDKHIISILETFLGKENYQVISYHSPLDFACINNETACCHKDGLSCAMALLTDFSMPGMNGLEALKALKEKNCKISKIALMSGFIDQIPQVSDLKIRFFHKPFVMSEIKAWLEE